MKIRTFLQPDMKSAIRVVREELGEDAVVLSTRKTEKGFEVCAAIDFDVTELSRMAERHDAQPTSSPVNSDLNRRATHAASLAYGDEAGPVKKPIKRQSPSVSSLPPPSPPVRVPAKPSAGKRAAAQPAQNSAMRSSRDVVGDPPSRAQTDHIKDAVISQMHSELKMLRGMMEGHISLSGWSHIRGNNPVYADLLARLTQMGLPAFHSKIIADNAVSSAKDSQTAWRHAIGYLSKKIPVSDQSVLDRGGVLTLVGASGVGKTTTIAKIAANFVMRHGAKSVSLISADNNRVGAHEQLNSYARILNIPMYSATSLDSLKTVWGKIKGSRLVLVDTPGLPAANESLSQMVDFVSGGFGFSDTYLCVPANAHPVALKRTFESYMTLNPTGAVITKADECGTLGEILSLLIEKNVPATFVTDGQRVPEDLHAAKSSDLVCRAVSASRHSGKPDEDYMAKTFGKSAIHI